MLQINSECILEESGISVVPPQRQQTASSMNNSMLFSVPSTHSRHVEPTAKATAPDDIDRSSSEEEDEEKDGDEEESEDSDGENKGDLGDVEKQRRKRREATPITPNHGAFLSLYYSIIH